MEVLPTHGTPERLGRLADIGFTAVSIGAQSFHDQILRRLVRPHDAAAARTAVENALGRFDCGRRPDRRRRVGGRGRVPGGVPRGRADLLRARRGPGVDVPVDAVRLHAVRHRPARPTARARGAGPGDRPRGGDGLRATVGLDVQPARRGAVHLDHATAVPRDGRGAPRSPGATSTSTTSGWPPTPTRSSPAASGRPLAAPRPLAVPRTTRSGRRTPAGRTDALRESYGLAVAGAVHAALALPVLAGLLDRTPGGFRLPRAASTPTTTWSGGDLPPDRALWAEMLTEHTAPACAADSRAHRAAPDRARTGRAWSLASRLFERPP